MRDSALHGRRTSSSLPPLSSRFLPSATGPQDRNLVFVGFAAAPLLAMLFASMVDTPSPSRWPRLVVTTLAVFNLVLAPLMLPPKCLAMLGAQYMFGGIDKGIPRDAGIMDKTLVLVWLPFEGSLYYSLSLRDDEGVSRPGRMRILALSDGDVSVTRPDELTLRLCPSDGFLASDNHRMLRATSRPFRKGDVVKLSNMTATVTETTDDGRPESVEFRFSSPLESPEWLWVKQAGMELVTWTPPKVGETMVVRAVR